MLKKRLLESLLLLCAIPILMLGIADTKEKTSSAVKAMETSSKEGNCIRSICMTHNFAKDILEISKNTFPIVTEKNAASQAGKTMIAEPAAAKPAEPKEDAKLPFIQPYEMFTNSYAEIRDNADPNAAVLTTFAPNTAVKVVEESGDWRGILSGEGIQGYLEASLLSESMTPIPLLNRWGIELTPEETDLLADIVYLEAGIDSMTGKEAVIEIIFNRMAFSNSYPKDLYSVLSQKGQFCTWPLLDSAAPGEEEYQAINYVVSGATYLLDPDYVFFSRRKANGHDFIKIGKHWFGRE